MKKILVAENLSYKINDTKLFQNLSFSLNEGAAIHILGSNGSGKTSLLKIISGLTKQTKGKIDSVYFMQSQGGSNTNFTFGNLFCHCS